MVSVSFLEKKNNILFCYCFFFKQLGSFVNQFRQEKKILISLLHKIKIINKKNNKKNETFIYF